ncbi:MAG: aldo/keto reductase [archaeon]
MDGTLHITSTRTLNNGVRIPLLGLGTYRATPQETERAVSEALALGYRHIDTAAFYANEQAVGKAVRDSKIPREELFITTKIQNDDHADPAAALQTSLQKLDMDYVDLYLIHWPVPERIASWKALELLHKRGLARAIGVSNFTIAHLQELLPKATITPQVNQVEFSPYLYQKELLDYCEKHHIVLEAYSPLTRGKKFDDERLLDIAKKHGKTPAQILIRWALQHTIVVLPKSTTEARIKENSSIYDFNLDKQDMQLLDSLNENLHVSWDPTNIV